MPVHVDTVQSEVSVESRGAEGPASRGGNLPNADELQQWLRMARRLVRDDARTRAIDCDD